MVNTVGARGITLRKGAELTYFAEVPKTDNNHRRRAAGECRSSVGAIDEEAIKRVIEHRGFQVVYQPILDLDSGEVAGVEACRASGTGGRRRVWFEAAETLGVAAELDLAIIEARSPTCRSCRAAGTCR